MNYRRSTGTRCGLQSGQGGFGTGKAFGSIALQAFCSSCIAEFSVTVGFQGNPALQEAGVIGDGHWLGSLPGWYASICVKLFLLAFSTLHFQFARSHLNWNRAIQLATRPHRTNIRTCRSKKSKKTVRSSKVWSTH